MFLFSVGLSRASQALFGALRFGSVLGCAGWVCVWLVCGARGADREVQGGRKGVLESLGLSLAVLGPSWGQVLGCLGLS